MYDACVALAYAIQQSTRTDGTSVVLPHLTTDQAAVCDEEPDDILAKAPVVSLHMDAMHGHFDAPFPKTRLCDKQCRLQPNSAVFAAFRHAHTSRLARLVMCHQCCPRTFAHDFAACCWQLQHLHSAPPQAVLRSRRNVCIPSTRVYCRPFSCRPSGSGCQSSMVQGAEVADTHAGAPRRAAFESKADS